VGTKAKNMATIKTNVFGIKAGDVITFTNSANHFVTITVTRVEEKSWYGKSRNSWNTLYEYSKYPDFKINLFTIKHF
jgi:hypothetical protein